MRSGAWLTAALAAAGTAAVLALSRQGGLIGADAAWTDEAARQIGAAATAYPPLPAFLAALLDSVTGGILPSPADALAALAAGALALAGGRLGRLAVPGLLLAVVEGPGVLLLCLAYLWLGLSLRRFADGDDPFPLIAAGVAAGLMPFLHPGGAALALACAPLGVALLSPALVAGRGFTGALLLGLFPLAALTAAFAALAALYGGDPWQPFAALLGRGPAATGGLAAVAVIPALLCLAPASAVLLARALGERGGTALLAASLTVAPALAALLHGLGGGAVSAGQVAGPAALAACLAPAVLAPALATARILGWALVLLAASAPGHPPC